MNLSRSQEETKKLKPSVPSGNAFGDCIFIDEDEENEEKKEAATLDQPMPMSLEEPYIEESDPMVVKNLKDLFSPSSSF